MFCTKCGSENSDPAKFCKSCGVEIAQIVSIEESKAKKEESVSKVPLLLLLISLFITVVAAAFEEASTPFADMLYTIAGLGMLAAPIWYLISCRNKKSNIWIKGLMIVVLLFVLGVFIAVILASLNYAGEKVESVSSDYSTDKISLSSIKKSVVNIYCESTIDGEISGGSGTMMTEDGIILTASHIFPQDIDTVYVDEDYGCLVMVPEETTGTPDEMYWASPIIIPGISDLYDIAFMEITDVYVDEDSIPQGQYPNTFHTFWGSTKYGQVCTDDKLDINLGDSVRVLGYPSTSGGLSLTITEGIISAVSDDGNLLTSAKIDSGNSGGIAVDYDGCVIGMPIAVREGDYQNLGQIIPGSQITKFLELIDVYLEE